GGYWLWPAAMAAAPTRASTSTILTVELPSLVVRSRRATVRAISAEAMRRGYEPQYRCQRENTASIALARRSGFTHFGEWEVVVPTAD
ncbi:MAG: hypothetical protein J0I66_07330, partial [Microbacterium sp.]|nr:hypothetical protein [Microbacterium sp.]